MIAKIGGKAETIGPQDVSLRTGCPRSAYFGVTAANRCQQNVVRVLAWSQTLPRRRNPYRVLYWSVILGAVALALAYIFGLAWLQGKAYQFYEFEDLVVPRLIDVTVLFWLFWVGSSIGSFLNVVAWRMPLGMSLNGRSACPRCCNQLKTRDNFPVLGWIALGGRCRSCRLPISSRYPIVEASVGATLTLIGIAELYQICLPYQIVHGHSGPLWAPMINKPILYVLLYHVTAVATAWAAGLIRLDGKKLPTGLVVFAAAALIVPLMVFPAMMIVPWKAFNASELETGWVAPYGLLDTIARVLSALAAAGFFGRSLTRSFCPTADPKLNPLGKGTRRLMDLIAIIAVPSIIIGWQALPAVLFVAAILAAWSKPMLPRSSDAFGRFAICVPVVMTFQIIFWRHLEQIALWPGVESNPWVVMGWAAAVLCVPLFLREEPGADREDCEAPNQNTPESSPPESLDSDDPDSTTTAVDSDDSGYHDGNMAHPADNNPSNAADASATAISSPPAPSASLNQPDKAADMSSSDLPYDSFLLVSFGGPEGPDDVIPFLENVLRGKNVPRERMLEVAEHYKHFGGVSPINEQNRELLKVIEQEFRQHGVDLPVYWGNRNWNPMLADTIGQMRDDGCKRTLAFFTNVFSSYSGCRQYRENIIAAREQVGDDAPVIEKVRMGFNHPGFIGALTDRMQTAADSIDVALGATKVLFTAHSIPMSMADNCTYEQQLIEACGLVADASGITDWKLVYQSRSGPPSQPWLEPDVLDSIVELDDAEKLESLVIMPIGFVSDHMEVLFDLDEEAADLCKERGIKMARAKTVGTHESFVTMIRTLVQERLDGTAERPCLGQMGPWHDVCPSDCCTYTPRRPRPAQ